jgi:hypothetical protein
MQREKSARFRPSIVTLSIAFNMYLALACPAANSGPKLAPYPTDMPDGLGSFQFVSEFGTAEYRGEWVGNRPKGRGTAVSGAYSCSGEFGISTDDPNKDDTRIYAKGDVYVNGKQIYQGGFTNLFVYGSACGAEGQGTRFIGDWKITGSFSSAEVIRRGPCEIIKGGVGTYVGICSAPAGARSSADGAVFALDTSPTADQFLNVEGQGAFTDVNGNRFEGRFYRGAKWGGLYALTRPGHDPALALVSNGKVIAAHPAPSVLAAKGKSCGRSDWLLMSGSCAAGKWSGAVNAYGPDAMRHLEGTFVAGAPKGEVKLTSFTDNTVIVGKLRGVHDGELSFERGRILKNEALVYEGEMNGFAPDGKGVCRFEGSMEACEFVDGERIDALYKIREENRKLTKVMEQQRQEEAARQAAATRQEEAAREAASTQQAEQGGFQWGKFAALATGATIGGIDRLPTDVQAKVVTGMVQDSMSGQEGINNSNAALAGNGEARRAGGPQVASGAGLQQERAAAQACANAPYNNGAGDPQFDTNCKLAQFDACLHRSAGIAAYDAEGRAACAAVTGLVRSTGSRWSCGYCPYPY